MRAALWLTKMCLWQMKQTDKKIFFLQCVCVGSTKMKREPGFGCKSLQVFVKIRIGERVVVLVKLDAVRALNLQLKIRFFLLVCSLLCYSSVMLCFLYDFFSDEIYFLINIKCSNGLWRILIVFKINKLVCFRGILMKGKKI